jgi:hypothetical protein
MRANILTPIMSFMTRFYRNSIFSSKLISENIFKFLPVLITGGMLILLSACEEDPSKIGIGLLPHSDFVTIKSTDTLTVKSYTMYKGRVESDNPSVSYVGHQYDPYFGTTTAKLVCQVRLSDTLTDLGSVVVDSIKLFLHLLSVRGDTVGVHYIKMSEIANQIYTDSAYYSNQTVPLTGKSWISDAFPVIRGDTINDIELRIPRKFGEYVLREKSMLFYDNDIPDFRSYFKGLCFEMISPDKPLLASLSVASPGSTGSYTNYFAVYMTVDDTTSTTAFFLLDAISTNAAFNLYSHDFSTAEADKKIQHINDTTFLDTLSYLQNLNGVYTRLEIPSLKTLKADTALRNVAVNKARLVLPFVIDNTNFTYSTIPTQLYLRYLTSTGAKYIVSDYSTAGSTFYDGKPDTTTAFSYNINIATYMQDYFKDATDSITSSLELFLDPTSSYNLILKANKSYKPVKFDFTYTKF